jgi:hypothetical protein
MFRATFPPIIRSTWVYLHYLVVFTQVAGGWCLGWFSTPSLGEFQLIQDTSRQQPGWILPDTVNTVKCSWWWAETSPETCTTDKEKWINLYSCILLVTFIIVFRIFGFICITCSLLLVRILQAFWSFISPCLSLYLPFPCFNGEFHKLCHCPCVTVT